MQRARWAGGYPMIIGWGDKWLTPSTIPTLANCLLLFQSANSVGRLPKEQDVWHIMNNHCRQDVATELQPAVLLIILFKLSNSDSRGWNSFHKQIFLILIFSILSTQLFSGEIHWGEIVARLYLRAIRWQVRTSDHHRAWQWLSLLPNTVGEHNRLAPLLSTSYHSLHHKNILPPFYKSII